MPTLPIAGGDLWYDVQGTGPPLVCLHGGWQSADSWRAQVERFADEYTVVTMDLRGHGRTGETATTDYSIDLLVDDLERLLAELDLEQPVLAGVSIGGMVVQSYLDSHPDGARGAVVSGPLQSMPPVDMPRGLKPFVSPLPAIAGMVSTVGSAATFEWLLAAVRATTGTPWLTVDPDVRAQSLATAGDVTPAEFREIFAALYRYDPPDLSHVQTPTLVLFGAAEAPPVKFQGRRLARTVASGTWQELPDAGHLANQDNPAAFNRACAAFLADLGPPRD